MMIPLFKANLCAKLYLNYQYFPKHLSIFCCKWLVMYSLSFHYHIRNQELMKSSIQKHDVVIHLACISNDPSFELNPKLGKSINLDSFRPMVEISKNAGVKRFIYASSSSVYGIKDEPNVHEDMSLEPLTDYSVFKINYEQIHS